MVPNFWGQKYLPDVAEGFAALCRAQKIEQQQKHDTEIRISAPASISTRWLASRLFEWSNRHKESAFQLRASDAEPDLQSGEADLRVTYSDHFLVHAHYAKLFVDAVTPVLSPRLAAHALTEPVELLNYPLIGVDWRPDIDAPPPGCADWLVHNGVRTHRTVPSRHFRSPAPLWMLRLVETGSPSLSCQWLGKIWRPGASSPPSRADSAYA